jgi:hypothetical protein
MGKKYANPETNLNKLLASPVEAALNSADRLLRKKYGKKLLEFFYPVPPEKHTFSCFDGLSDVAYSAYTAEWISFSRHKPFLKFLSSLAAYLEYHSIKKYHPDKRAHAPYLDPVWKYLCGLDENAPVELWGDPLDESMEESLGSPNEDGPSSSVPRGRGMELETHKIRRLREESDAVMEMLKIESIPEFEDKTEHQNLLPSIDSTIGNTMGSTRQGFTDWAAGLDETALGCLELLSQGKGAELEAFARQRNTMAEIIIDEINAQFLGMEGDLLIEHGLDGEPIIQEEYKDEVLWAITFRNV